MRLIILLSVVNNFSENEISCFELFVILGYIGSELFSVVNVLIQLIVSSLIFFNLILKQISGPSPFVLNENPEYIRLKMC